MVKQDFQQVMSSPAAAYEEGLAFLRGRGMANRNLLLLAADL